MARCQICNRILSDNELTWNKQTQEWDFLCSSCRHAIYQIRYEDYNNQQEDEDAEYRDGRCPMDR